MHGHMQPQQHPGMHPAHQPPPHLTHLTGLQPHSMQRDHPVNRLNQARHHHPRGGVVDHSQQTAAAAGMAPHLPMQVPPPPHQPQNTRKGPSAGYYSLPHGAGMPKPLPMTSPHMHQPPPPTSQQPQSLPPLHQQQQQHLNPMAVVGRGTGLGQHQAPVSTAHHPVSMQAPPPIPVVSAATPAGTKTRHIPSNTDHKIHHHGHTVLQSNGNSGPGSKGIANHHQTNQPVLTMDKTKAAGVNGSSGGNRHHHIHHHTQHPQQQQQQQQQHIVPKPNDAPLPKESPAVIPVTVSTAPSVAPTLPSPLELSVSGTGAITTAPTGGASSSSAPGETARDASAAAAAAAAGALLSGGSDDALVEALANIKEKTTMCLVNELARYNKIQHQYRLTGEAGPAHKKHFTVTLKLGDEEYTAEGASIKKAQHKAAGDAIAATKYKHPPARTNRRTKTGTKGNVSSFTPTVELNALAMKRGEPTVYQVRVVPVPVSKYGGGGASVTSAPPGGRRPVEEKPPGVGHQQQPPPPGAYGASAGYWCRANGPAGSGGGIAAGVGGRGGMGGFHPGHQQQQQQQHHGHHVRDDHANRHHAAQHNYHHHDGGGGGAGGGGGGGSGGGYGHHGGPAGPLVTMHEFYKAVLRVGERTFHGEGHTPQAARHDAAARALEVLKPLTTDGADGGGRNKSGDGLTNGDGSPLADGSTPSDDPNAELKSPISLVHEIAVQRSLSVVFEVISEKGPPHMTVFVTQCKVGTIVTEGEGTGKKLSKKRAAEKMLDELRKLQKAEQAAYASSSASSWPDGAGNPPVTPTNAAEKRKSNPKAAAAAASAAAADPGSATAKKKARNLIKERSAADVAEKENPISRLMQIQQARKEKQPVYTLVENDRPNVGRRRQFTMEVSASGAQATGTGMTKKAAKWNAAEALLVELGYATAEPKGSPVADNKENLPGAANDSSPSGGKRPRKVRFQAEPAQAGAVTTAQATAAGQPLTNGASTGTVSNGVSQGKGETSNDSMNDSIASNDSAGTNSSGVSSASSAAPKADIGAKKEQLMYLAQLLKFEVQFSDFPKGNHGEYLTLVILSTEPPQLCHGSGASLQESHDEAARGALEMLSKIGLDNVKPKAPASTNNSTAAPDDTITSPAVPLTTAAGTPCSK